MYEGTPMSTRLTHDEFKPCLSQTFRIFNPGSSGEPQELQLVEVELLGDPIPGVNKRHAFSLILQGPRETLLPQATYRFDNESLGAVEFMIVPLGPDQACQRYQAIFN